jgi:Ankyrin repeats (3 copies)
VNNIENKEEEKMLPMLETVQTGNLMMLKSLLVHDCASIIDVPISVGGRTSLFVAAREGCLEIVKVLTEHGASIDNQQQIVEQHHFLLQHKMDIWKL